MIHGKEYWNAGHCTGEAVVEHFGMLEMSGIPATELCCQSKGRPCVLGPQSATGDSVPFSTVETRLFAVISCGDHGSFMEPGRLVSLKMLTYWLWNELLHYGLWINDSTTSTNIWLVQRSGVSLFIIGQQLGEPVDRTIASEEWSMRERYSLANLLTRTGVSFPFHTEAFRTILCALPIKFN